MIVVMIRVGLMVGNDHWSYWCSWVSLFFNMMMSMNVMLVTMITMSCEPHHFDFLYLFKFWSVILLLLIYLKKEYWTGANQINRFWNFEYSLIWGSSRPLTKDQLLCYWTSKAQSCPGGNLIFQLRKYISEIRKILKLWVSCCASWYTGSKSGAAKLSLRCGNKQQRFSNSCLAAHGPVISSRNKAMLTYVHFSKFN